MQTNSWVTFHLGCFRWGKTSNTSNNGCCEFMHFGQSPMAGHGHRACLKIWHPNLLLHLHFPSFFSIEIAVLGGVIHFHHFQIFKHSIYWYFSAKWCNISPFISPSDPNNLPMVMAAPHSRRSRHGGRWVSTQTPQNTHSLGKKTSHPQDPPGDLPPKIINIDIYI